MHRTKLFAAARRVPVLAAIGLCALAAHAGERLSSYNVDLSQTTVSGVSAGAFFATQIHVAHSRHIKGMGSIAGGPYFCAEGSLNKAYNAKAGDAGQGLYSGQCMGGDFNGIDAAQNAIDEARQEEAAGRIDALSNLALGKVFIFGGTLDPTVVPNVVAQNKPFYTRLGVPEANLRVETSLRDGHAMPLKDSHPFANACGAMNTTYNHASVSPWMSNCNYDAAGLMLEQFYGTLNARVPLDSLRGRFVQFDQTEFTSAAGARYMNTEGFMYVPPSCAAGERCRVHIAFHGCHQVWDKPAGETGANMGDKFYRYAGYNEWAENNRLIILYPQAQKTPGVDPRGCFDWWGFEEAGSQNGPCNSVAKYTYGQCSSASYHTKEGKQIKAVWSMAERLAAGSTGGGNSVPVVTDVAATPNASCSTIRATVTDPDNDVSRVEVRIDGGSAVQATSAGNGTWTYNACPGTGTHTASVTAVDAHNNASGAQTVSFTIGSTGGGGLTPGSGTWVAQTQAFGLANAYVYAPKNPNPSVVGGKRALMLSLHGCAQSANDVINNHFNWESTAEQRGMVVIAPTPDAASRTLAYPPNCWNWFGASHSRSANDVAKLLQLVEAVKQRPELSIDPNQVYVSGLSAGSGEAHVLGCIAPDVFAGIGLVAGPALGSASGDVSMAPKRTAADVASTCRSLAGGHAGQLATQIASLLYGTSDWLVNPGHNVVNADGMKNVYGASTSRGSVTVTGGSGTLWGDAQNRTRLSLISITGMDHSWPAGPGGTQSTNYVNTRYLNYPDYLTKFLFDNNPRVGGSQNPVLRCDALATTSSTATLSCAATDNGTIASYRIVRTGPSNNTETYGSGATLSRQYTGLPAGHYVFDVTATDNDGLASNTVRLEGDVSTGGGTNTAPTVTGISASVSGQCVTVSGAASDADGQVASVEVKLNGANTRTVTPNSGSFSAQWCSLAAGSYTGSAVAIDNQGARSSERSATPVTVQQTVESATATVVGHYTAQRITLQQYLEMGARLGYNTSVTLYRCGTVWRESATCS